MRDPVSVATNFPRFEATGDDLCCHGDPMQTRWFYMQFLAEAPIQKPYGRDTRSRVCF